MCKPFLTTEIRWWRCRLHLTFHRLYPRANCKATGNYLPNDTLYAMTFHQGCAACILIKFSQNVFPFCEDQLHVVLQMCIFREDYQTVSSLGCSEFFSETKYLLSSLTNMNVLLVEVLGQLALQQTQHYSLKVSAVTVE